jgi:hypothetical protein
MADIKNYGIIGIGSSVQLGKNGGRLKYDVGNNRFELTKENGTTLENLRTANVSAATISFSGLNDSNTTITNFVTSDANILASNNDTTVPTTGAVIDYVNSVGIDPVIFYSADTGTGNVELDSDVLVIAGGTNLNTTANGNTITIALDSNISLTTVTANLTGQVSDISNHTTTSLAEGTNLYFTAARVRGNISVTDTGGDGSLSYDSGNGIITYTGPNQTEANARIDARLSGGTGITYTNGVIATTITQYTDTLARLSVSVTDTGGDGSLSYDNVTGVFTYTGPDQTEANARIDARLSGGTGITYSNGVIATTITQYTDTLARLAVSVTETGGDGSLSYDNVTGVFTYTGPDQTEANARIDARLSGGTGVTYTSGVISIGQDVAVNANVIFNRVSSLATPVNPGDAANKQYVDEVAEGLKVKPAVEVATTAVLSATYDNGNAGVGATLTATGSGAFPTIDGVTLTSTTPGRNGVLVKNQSTAAHNGRYNLTVLGDGDTPWVLTRCGLCDEASEIPGAYMFVKDGETLAGSGWVAIVADPSTFTVGTDAINFTQFSGAGTYTAGDGLALTGTVFSVDANIAGGYLSYSSGILSVEANTSNEANTVVARDSGGNFSAGTITANLTGTAANATVLQTARSFSTSGDATAPAVSFNGSGNVDLVLTLANTAVTSGVYGSSTQIPQFTVDSKGRITAASNISISTSFNIAADTGTTDTVAGGETLTFSGTANQINTVVSNNTITVSLNSNVSGLTSISAGTGTFTGNVSAGNVAATGVLSFGTLLDAGNNISITNFVNEAAGIANNDNDTTIPTSAAVIDYVANNAGDGLMLRASFTADGINSDFAIGTVPNVSGRTYYADKVILKVSTAFAGDDFNHILVRENGGTGSTLVGSPDADGAATGVYVITLDGDLTLTKNTAVRLLFKKSDGTTASVPASGAVVATVHYRYV